MIDEIAGTVKADAVLPDALSDLVYLAISDYAALDRGKYYAFSDQWHGFCHVRLRERYCGVCLAGAVIANTFEGAIELRYGPTDFSYDNQDKLFALNAFRLGNMRDALALMGIEREDMTLEQIELLEIIEREIELGSWNGLARWEGWDELDERLCGFAAMADRLRSVDL